jgi:hypothetical protein
MAGTKWTEHVKAYSLEHKISYKDAMKAAGATYKSEGKPAKEAKVEEVKPEEAKVEPVEAKVESDGVEIKPPQIKHKRAPKKVKDAFLLNVEEILKTEPEVVKKA